MIRFVEKKDAQALTSIYNYYVKHTVVTFDYDPITIKEMEDKIETIGSKYPFFVVEINEKIVGYAYGSRFRTKAAYDWAVETTVYIDQEYCSKGIGKALYKELLSALKLQGYVVIYACVTVPNPASDKLHARLGFEEIGIFKASGYKFNAWQDIRWYQTLLHDDITEIKQIDIVKEKYKK